MSSGNTTFYAFMSQHSMNNVAVNLDSQQWPLTLCPSDLHMLQSVDLSVLPQASIGLDDDTNLSSRGEDPGGTEIHLPIKCLDTWQAWCHWWDVNQWPSTLPWKHHSVWANTSSSGVKSQAAYLAGSKLISCEHFLCGGRGLKSIACCTMRAASSSPNPYLDKEY